jgi:hypothetical protein
VIVAASYCFAILLTLLSFSDIVLLGILLGSDAIQFYFFSLFFHCFQVIILGLRSALLKKVLEDGCCRK